MNSTIINIFSVLQKLTSSGVGAQLLAQAMTALFAKAVSFKLAGFLISVADVAGAPRHLTLSTALKAAEAVLDGTTGEITVGDLVLDVTPPAAAVAISPSAASTGAPAA